MSSILNWFACHLVALTFCGFVFAGVVVFDILPKDTAVAVARPHPGPGAEPTTRPSLDPQAGGADTDRQQPPPATASSPADADVPPTPVFASAEPVRKAPRLIGGNIPVYGPVGRPSERSAADAGGDTFRPSTEQMVTASEPSRDELVQHARKAYWNGDFEAAEVAYMALLEAFPGDANAFGELANLYHSMGRTSASRDAMYEAGVRLKRAGERDKLRQVIDFLSREHDARVSQLRP